MAVALILIVVSLLIGYLFDRMARSARLRRDKRFDWLAALLGTAAGAGLGWLDGEGIGAGLGAAIGFFGATLTASIVFGTLSVLWTLLRGPLPRRNEEKRPTTFGQRLGILLAGGLPVAFAVLIAHETYWTCNMVSLVAQNDLCSRVAESAADGQPRAGLKQNIENRRWHVAASTWRPMQWLLQPDNRDAARAELAFLDMIAGRKPPPEKPAAWTDLGGTEVVWTNWNMDAFDSNDKEFLRDETVRRVAADICAERVRLYGETVDRTWVLRYVPRELFVPAHRKADSATP